MEIAQTITFEHTKQSSNDKHCDDGHEDNHGGKPAKRCDQIVASFSTNDLADAILVQGTHDQHPIDKKKHLWESAGQYESLKVTLLYIKAGKVVETIAYDSNGKRIVSAAPPPVTGNQAVITNLTFSVAPSLDVTLGWQSSTETNLAQYYIYKQTSNVDDNTLITTLQALGSSQKYQALDNGESRGTFNYTICAVFNDSPEGYAGTLCGTIPNVTL